MHQKFSLNSECLQINDTNLIERKILQILKIAEEDGDDTEEDLDDMIDIADDGNVR